MKRILALTKYGRTGASSRVRTYQFLPFLEAAGFEVTISPLLNDAYLQRLYTEKRRSPADLAKAYARQVAAVATAAPHDLVWVEKEVFPWAPYLFERLATLRLGPMVVDYDDALFHQYDLARSPLVRAALSRKIGSVMRRSVLVVAGNDYLADYALRAGAGRVEILPSVVDVPAYPLAAHAPGRPVTIGWIGSPMTARYLEVIQGPLAALQAKYDLRIKLIGSGPLTIAPLKFDIVPWTEASEAAELTDIDIGVMPLADTPWERGKCGYKIIQYMAAGLPTVATALGANMQIVDHGRSGFLASSPEEWSQALEQLILDAAARKRMGAIGRQIAEARYSTHVAGPRLVELLRSV